ncbi:hypothetical protein MDAP_001761 [Mitosporidium daphniae]|uniref:Uncharacterized protein n=1 Tax=Mitosporidium daphniae TaxID=1485682 RepID=A0A098VXG5_9MICR|nr:uncharacterized protein DI09_176p20 [Mitosporidium daphniae]KGG52416.1 hypothetical protein DI09_176p20 [Mitosporidium daphniae]|eukprot:XP_013238852.1 uncharacterized protein DI09_176p20 [Mitosporidium daphniae]
MRLLLPSILLVVFLWTANAKTLISEAYFIEVSNCNQVENIDAVLGLDSIDNINKPCAKITAQKMQIHNPGLQLWRYKDSRFFSLACGPKSYVISPKKADVDENGVFILDSAKPIIAVGIYEYIQNCKYQKFIYDNEKKSIFNPSYQKFLTLPSFKDKDNIVRMQCSSDIEFTLRPYADLVFFIYNPITEVVLRAGTSDKRIYAEKVAKNFDKLINCLQVLWYSDKSSPNVFRSAVTGDVLNVREKVTKDKKADDDLNYDSDDSSENEALVVLDPFSSAKVESFGLFWDKTQFGSTCYGIISPESNTCDPVKATSAVKNKKLKTWIKVPLSDVVKNRESIRQWIAILKKNANDEINDSTCNSIDFENFKSPNTCQITAKDLENAINPNKKQDSKESNVTVNGKPIKGGRYKGEYIITGKEYGGIDC